MIAVVTQPLEFAIRLADEGVPLRAIARAIRIPSEDLRLHLIEAKDDGRLIDLPRDDWPPGFPRDQRALQLSRMQTENQDALFVAIQKMFHLTRGEASLLLALVQNMQVSRSSPVADQASKVIDVHVCRLRRYLEPFGVEITTLWGSGYQIATPQRRKIMDLILGEIHPSDTTAF